MPKKFKDGDIVPNPKDPTQIATYHAATNSWTKSTVAPGSPIRNAAVKMTNPDKGVINKLTEQSQSAIESMDQYAKARPAIHRLKTGPFRGRILDAAIPEENGGFWDAVGAGLVGTPMRALGLLTQQDIEDRARIKGLSSKRVLEGQVVQKGPQTDSDAARLGLTEISLYKPVQTNDEISSDGMAHSRRAIARAEFITKFANQYGVTGVDPQGRTAEQAFQQIMPPVGQAAPEGVTVRRIK